MAKPKFIQENGETIIPITHEDAVLDNNGQSISSKYVQREDSSLMTTSKNVVDAINELSMESVTTESYTNGDDIQIEQIDYSDVIDDVTSLQTDVGDLSSLQTKDKSNLVGALNELFQDVDSGKQLIADAIDDENITKNSTFSAMSEAITNIKQSAGSGSPTDGRLALYYEMIDKGYVEANETMSINELVNLLEECDFDPNEVKQIFSGDQHTFLIKNDGSLWACGYNSYGQLGLGTTSTKYTFTQVTENINNDVERVFCFSSHTFILKTDGTLWASGWNSHGQLGLGDNTNRNTFTKVEGMDSNVKEVVCGSTYTFLIKNDGSLWATGGNSYGYLGLGDTTNRNTFTKVTTNINNDVKQATFGGGHAFIVKTDGSLWGCGLNNVGQLGLNDATNRTTFTKVTTNINNDVKQVVCGDRHTVILKNDGSVWSSGRNAYGSLGLGDTSNRTTFTQAVNNVKQISCHCYTTVIQRNDGTLWACGYNDYGQFGISDTDYKTTFIQIAQDIGTNIREVIVGYRTTFIIMNDGTIYAAGYNYYGQLGLDPNTERYKTFTITLPLDTSPEYQDKLKVYQFLKSAIGLPVRGSMSIEELLEILIDKGDQLEDVLVDVKDTLINLMQDNNHIITDESLDSLLDLLKKSNIDIGGIKQIACGSYHAVVLKNDGSVWTTGYNNRGQLGVGDTSNRTTFTKVTTNINNDVKQIACGNQHTFILKNDDSVWSCGYNVSGQLGLGNIPNQTTFAQVTTNINNDVKQIACGNNSAIILKKDGSIWSCGYNSYGQLGLNDTSNRASFTQVTTNINNDVKQVFCGYNHTFILKNDGSLWASGYNNYGQLGLGDTTNRTTFTQVTTNINNDVKQVANGQFHTLILKNDGSLWSCGQNDYGQLGLNDTTTNRTTFTQVINNAKQIACGEYYTIILKNDDSVWSCGVNDYGQLGLGDTTQRTSFTKVTTNISNIKQIACGYYHVFIIKNDGSIWGCGLNDEGQSGFGDYSNRKTFTQVPRGF